MSGTTWLLQVVMAILMWTATSLLYKAGIHGGKEEHICLKYSVCVGLVFFVIALVYLVTRDEPFTIRESAVRYWPMTVFGIVYAVVNTISFNGYIYNEATVESPVEGISGGTSTLLLIVAYLALGRVDSISRLLTPLRTAGILDMEYAIFALGCWIYICLKEGKPYNSFTRSSAPRILGAVADSVGIVFYSYAMAINSVSTDPLLAVYPVFVMVGGRVIMKEKASTAQYILLLGIVAGSVMVIAGTVF